MKYDLIDLFLDLLLATVAISIFHRILSFFAPNPTARLRISRSLVARTGLGSSLLDYYD